MAGRLAGKSAVITGAGRGIGRATALLMAQEGAKIVVADNGSSWDGSGSGDGPAQEAAREIIASGGQAVPFIGDVSSWTDAEAMVQTAIDSFGKLDILVNCAGNWAPGTILDTTVEDWERFMRIHLLGTFATGHFAAKHWNEKKSTGRLITFTSGAGILGSPQYIGYSTAKMGIVGFTLAFANSFANSKVTANCISPFAATRLSDRAAGFAYESYKETGVWPSKDPSAIDGDPASVGNLIVYLVSDDAAHISGHIFGARGRRYSRYNSLTEECVVLSENPWDVERLFEEFPRSLGAGLSLDDLPSPLADLDNPEWETLDIAPDY